MVLLLLRLLSFGFLLVGDLLREIQECKRVDAPECRIRQQVLRSRQDLGGQQVGFMPSARYFPTP